MVEVACRYNHLYQRTKRRALPVRECGATGKGSGLPAVVPAPVVPVPVCRSLAALRFLSPLAHFYLVDPSHIIKHNGCGLFPRAQKTSPLSGRFCAPRRYFVLAVRAYAEAPCTSGAGTTGIAAARCGTVLVQFSMRADRNPPVPQRRLLRPVTMLAVLPLLLLLSPLVSLS